MEDPTQIQQEKLQIKNEKLLYDMAEKGIFDHKTDYEKGKQVLLQKKGYMPSSDMLSKNESNFIAKNYPEMVELFLDNFNWKQSSGELVKWGGSENIKKYFEKLELRQCVDDIAKYEPELYENIKQEINRKIPISFYLPVPVIQMQKISKDLKERGFNENDPIIAGLEKHISSQERIFGHELLETLSEVKDDNYLSNVKYDYLRGLNIVKQCSLFFDNSSIDHIKINDKQHLKLPFLGKKFDDIKENLEELLKGNQTKIIEGLKTKDQTFDAKLQLLIDPKTGKLKIISQKKAMKLDIPGELSESEVQKLKNGERIALSRGFLHNYKTVKDKSSLLLRKIIADRKLKSAKEQEIKASMILDKELNKLVINYIIKEENSKDKEKIEAIIIENGDESPSIYLKDDTKATEKSSNPNRKKQVLQEINQGIASTVQQIKTKQEDNQKEKEVRKIIGMETKGEAVKTTSIKHK